MVATHMNSCTTYLLGFEEPPASTPRCASGSPSHSPGMQESAHAIGNHKEKAEKLVALSQLNVMSQSIYELLLKSLSRTECIAVSSNC